MTKSLPINNKKENIKVFKLITGEDIIGYLFSEEEKRNALNNSTEMTLLIGAPKIIKSVIDPGTSDVIMSCDDWIPYAENPVALIMRDKIIAIFKPNSQYLDFYLNSYWDAQYYVSDLYHQKTFLEMYNFNYGDTYQ